MERIVIATIKEWNIKEYFQLKSRYKNKYKLYLISNREELNSNYLDSLKPKYIFFPHWSWIIPDDIYKNYECIVFHMTDLPYGRGGSPLQNLIERGIYDTKISALRVEEGLDTGDIYLKEDFNISIGSAEEIFIRLSEIIFNKMIPKILSSKIIPKKQIGKSEIFKRRNFEQSNILSIQKNITLEKMYDFIRMLDAEGYPKAYISITDKIKIEFSEVHLKSEKLVGRFEVKRYE